MNQIILRPDQFALKVGTYASWERGNRNVLLVSPTGGGKSIVVSDIVLDKDRLGAKQCVIAHRKELVGQLSMHVARRGVKHRIIGPKNVISEIVAEHRREFNGYSFVNPEANCSVAGVDTLVAREENLKKWAEQQDYWTIDEAHHVLRQNKWGKAVRMFPRAYGLGVTASPRRGDGMGLGAHHDGVFHDMIIGLDQRTLINMGNLSDYEIVIPLSDFHVNDEDFNKEGELSFTKGREASKRSHIVGDVVKEYIKYAYGKRGICFATDVETAGEIATSFNLAGIPAASVSSETPSDVRAEYIRRFRDGRLWMLVNVDLFGEGFDVPAVEVVIMARPTASLAVYLQQFGRALRTIEGKVYGLIIDHVSNYKRHGLPDKNHNWTLDRVDKREKREKDPEDIELVRCMECTKPYSRLFTCCPHCGHEPIIEPLSRSQPEKIDGDLILLDRTKLEELRKATELESPASLALRVAQAAGANAAKAKVDQQIHKHQMQQRLRDAINQWAGIQRHKGRTDQESFRRFFIATGMDVLTSLSKDRTWQEYEKTAIKVEGWFKS
mgnify:FL=1